MTGTAPRPSAAAPTRRRALTAALLGTTALLAPAPAAHAQRRPAGPVLVVAADGSGGFSSVQAAVDALPADAHGATILLRPGRYREVVTIPATAAGVELRGATGDPRDVVVEYDNASGTPKPGGGTYGTTGSATVTNLADEVVLRRLTIANTFDEAAHPEISNRQAVALKSQGDRVLVEDARFLGNQDTLYVNGGGDDAGRQLIRRTYVEGDVDFVFGSATAVFERCTFRALSRGSSTLNGYVFAPSTPAERRGFLVVGSRIVSDAPAGTYFLGRPWYAGRDAALSPEAVVRDTWLDAAFGAQGWSDMSGFPWQGARLAEHGNRGPGALSGPGRPQLDARAAAAATRCAWPGDRDGRG